MIHEAKAQGATIEEALKNAREALNAPADADVHAELISHPSKGLLGLFKKKAEARAYYETPDAPVKKQQPKPQKQQPAPQKAAQQPQQPKAAKKQQPAPQQEEAAPKTEIAIDAKPGVKAGAAYLLEMVKLMGVREPSLKAFVHADNEVLLELDCGEDYGIVIGRRGETLDAIQYLTRLVANKQKTEGEYSRISINVGNYREKRKSTLASLAKKNADRVLKYGRNFTFEPMNPYERRIIHTTIQEIEGVTSHSVGNDDDRRVVITLAEGVKPTHPGGGRNGGNRGRNSGRGGRGGRGGNRGGSQTVSAPTRAPKTDAGAEGVSLYGKLN
ncbi:MAG: protein jag [Clostridia bacterium]|nr:protein jag [Clostridia bacterium]